MSDRTWVTIGANEIPDYQFLAPLTAAIWRDRIGFHPIVLVVGNWLAPHLGNISTRKGAATLRALNELNLDWRQVTPMEGLETGRTAQQCREFVGCLDLPADDWAMPADADLWPIRKEFYYQHQAKPGRVTSYYSNGDHYQTLPTCHVTMQLVKWRELYGVKAGDDITAACKRTFEAWLPVRKWQIWDVNFAKWMADQAIVAEKVFALPEGFEKIERYGHPPLDRIDRNNPPPPDYDIANYVDAHMVRRPDEPDRWPFVRDLFVRLLPQHAAWADQYHKEYTEVMKCVA